MLFSDDLIPEFQEWARVNPNDVKWKFFLNYKTDLQTALSVARLFAPDIIKKDGCYFLRDTYSEDTYNEWKKELGDDKTKIEYMMNYGDVSDFFCPNTENDGNYDAEVQALAHTLEYFWTNWFRDQYPEAHLKVGFFDDDGELSITVYAIR